MNFHKIAAGIAAGILPATRRGQLVLGSALILAACQSVAGEFGGPALSSSGRGSPVNIRFLGAHPSHAWRKYGRAKRLISFPTPIQHVVVISMENRTVDNLFAGFYGQVWTGPGGGHWQDQNNFNLYNPNATPTLQPNGLSAHFSPNHSHEAAWGPESQGNWNAEPIACPSLPCPPNATAYSYAPTSDTGIYAQLVEKWAFANNVLQANEGPSFVAHQYYIAGQSGGIQGSLTSPYAEAENAGGKLPARDPTGNYIGPETEDLGSSGCNPAGSHVGSINMSAPVPPSGPLDNGGRITSCEEYPSNILDEIAAAEGKPALDDWQYIAYSDRTVWAAPLGISHLWNQYNGDSNKGVESFAVDPDAFNFALNVSGSSNPAPDPARPFPALTYVTPCEHESDHPELYKNDDGPQWLAWLINTIGESKYWKTTTIIVTWDDWGGWFDHVPPVPKSGAFRPPFNKYNNPQDPNEWGFRVPFIVISPYIKARGFISSQATSGFQYRSQSVMLQYIEATFGLASLGGDDYQNNQNDGLADIFNFSRKPLRYAPIATTFAPGPVGGGCPKQTPYVRHESHHMRPGK